MVKGKPTKNPKASCRKSPDNYWKTKKDLERRGKKLFVQKIFADWCKACGICVAFCPAGVFAADKDNRPVIKDPDLCTGCRFCEYHCPDFALSIHKRYPDRRKKNDGA
jgi:2-oxoglutarate ferredoxin oxidoreductase subunit delta